MSLDRAIELLKVKYQLALDLRYIGKPLAWALYQVWKEADREKRGKPNG